MGKTLGRPRGDEGAAAVEFALVSIILFLLLFGIIDFGFGLYRQQSATHGAREGARRAAVSLTSCAAFETLVTDRADGADVDAVRVEFENIDGDANDHEVGDSVVVHVDHTVTLSMIAGLIPGLPDTLDLTQTAKARLEQAPTGDTTDGC